MTDQEKRAHLYSLGAAPDQVAALEARGLTLDQIVALVQQIVALILGLLKPPAAAGVQPFSLVDVLAFVQKLVELLHSLFPPKP